MDSSVMKELIGQYPLQNFWARTALGALCHETCYFAGDMERVERRGGRDWKKEKGKRGEGRKVRL